MIRATVLGCGSSGGVPRLGNRWGECDPLNPKNRRRRCSLLVERLGHDGTTRVLIDTGPDMVPQLLDAGVKSAIINLGGNVLCVGEKPDGSKFHIGLQKPFADRDETFEVLGIDDLSVVTSGVYERHFEVDGKNYHHILN